MSIADAMNRWVDTNQNIEKFVSTNNLSCKTVFYDELAMRPQDTFPELCRFLGVSFDVMALQYWNFEHHGMGGNGAAINVIGKYDNAKVITGDENFYKKNMEKTFYDLRWTDDLSLDNRYEVETNQGVVNYLKKLNRSFFDFDQCRKKSEVESLLSH